MYSQRRYDMKVQWWMVVTLMLVAGACRIELGAAESPGHGFAAAENDNRPSAERTVTDVLGLKPGQTLVADVGMGAIDVLAEAGQAPRFSAVLIAHAPKQSQADQLVNSFSLVPVQKRRFFAISAPACASRPHADRSACGFPCAAYQSTPPRKSLSSLILQKNRSFLPREPRCSHPGSWMGTR